MSFTNNCIAGIEPNNEQINKNISQSLMLVTALSPHIGYENAARIAKKAFSQNKSLREAAIESELVNSVQFDDWVVPEKMTRPEKSDRIGRGQSKS
jgi:fumarate hydratase class II